MVAIGNAPATRERSPRVPNQPAPWTVGPNAGQGNASQVVGTPTYLPGTNPVGAPAPTGTPQNLNTSGGAYTTDPNGNFLAGDPVAYAKNYAGMYPNGTVGQYQDALSLAARNTAQNNYGAAAANLDRSEGNIKSTFEEMLGLLNRSKTKNIGSLADSMSDRGLTNSGVYLNSTDELNRNYADQLSGQTRQKDQQLGGIQQNRVNISNALAQALAAADQEAYQRKLQAWNDQYQAGLKIAQDALKNQGLM